MNNQKSYSEVEQNIKIQYYKSCFGELIIGSYDDQLCICDWRYRKARTAIDARIQTGLNSQYKEQNSEVVSKTILQLEEYFNKERTYFDLPILFVGTDFQKSVWQMLTQIPYGTTESYGRLSERMNNPKAVRAVAAANGANSISIIVPCHRIIGQSKQLVGYAGGIQVKKKLLELESSVKTTQLSLF